MTDTPDFEKALDTALRLAELHKQNQKPQISLKVQETLINNSTTDEIYETLERDPETTLQYLTKKIQKKLNTTKKIILTDIPKLPSYITKIHEIREQNFNKLIIIQGIIKRTSAIQFIIHARTYKCPECQTLTTRTYELGEMPKAHAPCGKKTCKHIARQTSEETIGVQTIDIEETEQEGLARNETITCLLQGALTHPHISETINVGNPITIIGKAEKKQEPKRPNIYRKQILAYGIETIDDDRKKYIPTPEDINQLKEIQTEEKDLVKYWAKKLYTAIHGHQNIKEAIIVQLIGTKTTTKNAKTNRGFIHQLLIGDGGSAKSTFLKITHQYALKSRYTTGAGSTAVGLTAGVIRDELSGQYQLEAGAFPLAHKGILELDEAEKMPEEQQDNLHEALEQGTQSISKAGIQATLQCQTSLLGAGNSRNTNIDQTKDIYPQIPFKDTFINRMDLIWILVDNADATKDLAIGKKQINNWENNKSQEEETPETITLFKKYQYLAKTINTQLTEELQKKIPEWYADLRLKSKFDHKSIRINPRTLDAIIRLTLSHARANLRETANEEDLEWAKKIYLESLSIIAVDMVTGQIDVQKLETGLGHSERKVDDIIIDTIKINGSATFEEIRNAIDNRISDRVLETLIGKMKQSGEIYEPKNNQYRHT